MPPYDHWTEDADESHLTLRRRRRVDDWMAEVSHSARPSRRRSRPVHDWTLEPHAGTTQSAEETEWLVGDLEPLREPPRRAMRSAHIEGDHRSAPARRLEAARRSTGARQVQEAPDPSPRVRIEADDECASAQLASAEPASAGPARRTITITGRGAERWRDSRTYDHLERHNAHVHGRHGKPDRIAMWAVLLGIALAIGAATSSHAAILSAHAAILTSHALLLGH